MRHAGGNPRERARLHVQGAALAVRDLHQDRGRGQAAERETDDAQTDEEVAPHAERLALLAVLVPREAHRADVVVAREGQLLAVLVDERGFAHQRPKLQVLRAGVTGELQREHGQQQAAPDAKAGEVRRDPVAAAGSEADDQGAGGDHVVAVPTHDVEVLGVVVEPPDAQQREHGGHDTGDQHQQRAADARAGRRGSADSVTDNPRIPPDDSCDM